MLTFIPKLYVKDGLLTIKLEYNLKNKLSEQSIKSDIEDSFKKIASKAEEFIAREYGQKYLYLLKRFDTKKIDDIFESITDANLKKQEITALKRIISLESFNPKMSQYRLADYLKEWVSNYEAGK